MVLSKLTKYQTSQMNSIQKRLETGYPQCHIPAFNIRKPNRAVSQPSGFSLLMQKGNDKSLLELVEKIGALRVFAWNV